LFPTSGKNKFIFCASFSERLCPKDTNNLKQKKMKKLIYPMIVLGALILLGTNVAEAQKVDQKKVQTTQTAQSDFVDTNKDGICDNYDGSQPGKGLGPGNGQGLGRTTGKGLGKGAGLRDGSGNGQRRLDGSGGGRNLGNGRQLRDGSGGNCPTPSK
jgi:hypothetical protein